MTCAGCGKPKRVHCRGLCRRCYDTPAVRATRPDARVVVREVDVAARNTVLMDPEQVPVGLLECLAKRAAARWGKRVDAADLVQEAWVVLIRSARTHDPTRKDLLHYALRGVKARMRDVARLACREATFVPEDEDYDA